MSFLSDIFKKSSIKQPPEKFTIRGVNVCVSAEEKPFVEELFSSLAAIPTGRWAIEDMKKYKTEFLLETSMGTTGGCFEPGNNRIVMAKSMGMDFMQFALVHEARHLLQDKQGRHEVEEKKSGLCVISDDQPRDRSRRTDAGAASLPGMAGTGTYRTDEMF